MAFRHVAVLEVALAHEYDLQTSVEVQGTAGHVFAKQRQYLFALLSFAHPIRKAADAPAEISSLLPKALCGRVSQIPGHYANAKCLPLYGNGPRLTVQVIGCVFLHALLKPRLVLLF